MVLLLVVEPVAVLGGAGASRIRRADVDELRALERMLAEESEFGYPAIQGARPRSGLDRVSAPNDTSGAIAKTCGNRCPIRAVCSCIRIEPRKEPLQRIDRKPQRDGPLRRCQRESSPAPTMSPSTRRAVRSGSPVMRDASPRSIRPRTRASRSRRAASGFSPSLRSTMTRQAGVQIVEVEEFPNEGHLPPWHSPEAPRPVGTAIGTRSRNALAVTFAARAMPAPMVAGRSARAGSRRRAPSPSRAPEPAVPPLRTARST